MSVLSDVNTTLGPIGIPLETGVFTGIAPDKYIVVVPLVDTFGLNADNAPSYDIQEARISLYSKSNYIADGNMHSPKKGAYYDKSSLLFKKSQEQRFR